MHSHTRDHPSDESICYVVPAHSAAEDSHFAHLPRLLSAIGERCKLFVIIEKSDGPVQIPNAEVFVQKHGRGPRWKRAWELLALVRHLRQRGCRRFFVRISVPAALLIGLFGRLLGLRLFYWNAGQPTNAAPAWREQPARRVAFAFRALLLRGIVALADRFVTGPESMVNYYAKHYGLDPRNAVVLYNDVDVAGFRLLTAGEDKQELRRALGLPLDRKIALFVGRISQLKGGCHLPAIAAALKAAQANALVAAVGGVHLPGVVRHAEEQRLGEWLRFIGSVPNRQVINYLLAADAFILPSVSEGFPRVLAEAMAAGLPAVCFAVGGVRDILGPQQQEFVVPGSDLAAFSDRLDLLLSDSEIRKRLAAENLEQVQRFATDRVAEMFVERLVKS